MTDNSINEFRNNFTKVYHNRVVPVLMNFEEERIKIKRIAAIISICVVIVILIALCIYSGFWKVGNFTQEHINEIITYFACFVFCSIIATFIIHAIFKKWFENKIKARIMPILMPAFGD